MADGSLSKSSAGGLSTDPCRGLAARPSGQVPNFGVPVPNQEVAGHNGLRRSHAALSTHGITDFPFTVPPSSLEEPGNGGTMELETRSENAIIRDLISIPTGDPTTRRDEASLDSQGVEQFTSLNLGVDFRINQT